MDHKEFLAEIGRKGGLSKSKKKQEQFKAASQRRWLNHVPKVKKVKNGSTKA